MKILVICKHNRYRSKVGEALLRKLAGDAVEVRGAGIKIDVDRPYVAENVKIALKEHGVEVVDEVSRLVSEEDKVWADKIIIAADNVDRDLFPSEKTIVWPAHDCDESEIDKIRETVRAIEYRIKEFLSKIMV